MITKYNSVPDALFMNRLHGLINDIYKILPMYEEQCDTRTQYIEGLLRELTGMEELIIQIQFDRRFHSLLNILEYLHANTYDITVCKKEVFHAINLIKALEEQYTKG